MLENIITCLFFTTLPLLLFAHPKTRRRTGSWITAWKTVPLGCLVMLMVPTALYGIIEFLRYVFELFPTRYLRHGVFRLGLGAFGLALGILTIVLLARWNRRKFHAEGKRSWLPFPAVFLVFAVGNIVLSILFFMFHFIPNPADYRGKWVAFELPKEKNVKIAFEQCGAHPFLAEYDYRLRFKREGKTEYRNLQMNTGGCTYFNVYRLKDGRLYFVDKDSRYIVDPEKGEILYVLAYEKRFYSVPYPREKFNGRGWRMESGKLIFHYDGRRIEAVPLGGKLDGKVYYGRITDGFYSASEKKEWPVSEWRSAPR